ncbi:Hypothetical protein D9617_2g058960 [Elsinoe fawcettii]|nr:Hypothetical protein D9617_2g058960 [Elsinoe fawcettii]
MVFERLKLLDPLRLLALSLAFLPITLYRLYASSQLHKATGWSSLRDAWFGTFWSWLGPRVAEGAAPQVEPLLSEARGVVLDIGPGNGQWIYMYSPQRNKKITKVYGLEPNLEHHAALRQKVKQHRLEGIYEVLGTGADQLEQAGLQPGSVDTVITIQVMCSVPSPKPVIKSLYRYIKPGGQWIMYEHVKTKYKNDFVYKWQGIIDIVWPTCLGGCSITRPTDEDVASAGQWSSIDIHPLEGEGKYDVIPHAVGFLRK